LVYVKRLNVVVLIDTLIVGSKSKEKSRQEDG
jgi:hypothetical protein